MLALKALVLVPTTACNITCAYCISEHNSSCTEMLIDTAFIALEKFISLQAHGSVPRLLIYGGEPLLRLDFIEAICDRVDLSKIKLDIFSNGFLLDARVIDRLRLSTGVGLVLSWRGKKTVKAVSLLRHLGLQACIRELCVTVQPENIPFAAAGVDFAASFGLPFSLNAVKETRDFKLAQRQKETVACFIVSKLRDAKKQGWNENRLADIDHAVAECGIYSEYCYAQGASQLVIWPDGRVGICQGTLFGLPPVFIQHVSSEKLAELFSSSEWAIRYVANIPECAECDVRWICGGGCGLQSLNNSNTTTMTPDHQQCLIAHGLSALYSRSQS